MIVENFNYEESPYNRQYRSVEIRCTVLHPVLIAKRPGDSGDLHHASDLTADESGCKLKTPLSKTGTGS